MKQLSQLSTTPVCPVITHLHAQVFPSPLSPALLYSQQLHRCRGGSQTHTDVHRLHRGLHVYVGLTMQVHKGDIWPAREQTLTHPVMPICSPILQYSASSSLLPVKQCATAGTLNSSSRRIAVKRSAASRQCKNRGFCSSLASFTCRDPQASSDPKFKGTMCSCLCESQQVP